MEEIRTVIDRKPTLEFVKGHLVLAIFALSFSILIFGLYILFGFLDNGWVNYKYTLLLILGAILFPLAALLLFTYKTSLKKADEFNRLAVYQFYEDYLFYEIYRNEEKVEEGKQYYTDLLDYKEGKEFVFVRLRNNTYFVISKVAGLTDFLNSKNITKHKMFGKRK